MSDSVTLTVDDELVEVPVGTSMLKAARISGIPSVMDAYREQALAIMNGSGTHAGAA